MLMVMPNSLHEYLETIQKLPFLGNADFQSSDLECLEAVGSGFQSLDLEFLGAAAVGFQFLNLDYMKAAGMKVRFLNLELSQAVHVEFDHHTQIHLHTQALDLQIG